MNTSGFDLFVSIVTSKSFISFVSFILGIIVTLVSPWNKWAIETRKLKLESRKQKIQQWRDELNKHNTFLSFANTSTFNELKHKVPTEELNNFYSPVIFNNALFSTERVKLGKFYQVVAEIEKEWGII